MNHIETLKEELENDKWSLKDAEQYAQRIGVKVENSTQYTRLVKKIAALTAAIADMERMEWMEEMKGIGCYRVWVNGYGAWIANDRNPTQPPQTFREAISAAMKGDA